MISEETTDNLIEKALDFANGESVAFAFQGGEPTLRGIEYFQYFCKKVDELNTKKSKIYYGLQTNGTLIDEEWAKFFKEKDFLIGLSLDGDFDNNAFRIDGNNQNAFYKIIKAADIFTKIGVQFNILTVLTGRCAENIDEILEVGGIDEIHIGLNDLHLGYGMTFMFELVADGTVEKLCNKIKKKNISYGFGGVARVGTGTLPAECILGEHYRLGSERVILSRAFCDVTKETGFEVVKEKFNTGVRDIRNFEKELLKTWNEDTYKVNQQKTKECVQKIVEIIKNK